MIAAADVEEQSLLPSLGQKGWPCVWSEVGRCGGGGGLVYTSEGKSQTLQGKCQDITRMPNAVAKQ